MVILADRIGEQLEGFHTWSLEDFEHLNNTLAEGVGCKRYSKRRVVVIEHYHIVFRESITNAMFGKCDTKHKLMPSLSLSI